MNLKAVTISLIIFTVAYGIYINTAISGSTPYNYFTRLSESFLQGKVYLEENPAWLNELIPVEGGKYYVAYPPMPAIMAIPFVMFSIADKSQTFISILFACFNGVLFYWLMKKIYTPRIAAVSTVLLMFGTNHWYLATEGSSWYIAHIFAVFFLLLALLTYLNKNEEGRVSVPSKVVTWFFVGVSVGAAYWSRLPAILGAPFFVLLPVVQKELRKYVRHIIVFCIGVGIFLLLNFGYNYIRFGTISDKSYVLIPGVLDEPWFTEGIFSLSYLPKNIIFFFTKMPAPFPDFPYYKPTLEGMSFFLTSPFFIFLPFIKWKRPVVWLSVVIGVVMLMPGLLHGTPGFAQFGYRFAMEATPFFLLALGSFMERKWWWVSLPFMVLAIAINYWGIYFIRTLGIH